MNFRRFYADNVRDNMADRIPPFHTKLVQPWWKIDPPFPFLHLDPNGAHVEAKGVFD